MTDSLFLQDENTASKAKGLAILKLDPDQYLHHLKGINITEEQANELLETLWQIMQTMVNIGWGVDALNLMLPEIFNQHTITERSQDD